MQMSFCFNPILLRYTLFCMTELCKQIKFLIFVEQNVIKLHWCNYVKNIPVEIRALIHFIENLARNEYF